MPETTKKVLLVEDERGSVGVVTGFLASTLRSMGYRVEEAHVDAAAPTVMGFRLMALAPKATGTDAPPPPMPALPEFRLSEEHCRACMQPLDVLEQSKKFSDYVLEKITQAHARWCELADALEREQQVSRLALAEVERATADAELLAAERDAARNGMVVLRERLRALAEALRDMSPGPHPGPMDAEDYLPLVRDDALRGHRAAERAMLERDAARASAESFRGLAVQLEDQVAAERRDAERLRAEIALLSDSRGTSSRGTP